MLARPAPVPIPWLRLSRPSERQILERLEAHRTSGLTYPHPGATGSVMPAGWETCEEWVELGGGAQTWSRARRALDTWAQFDLSWVIPFRRDVPLRTGALFAFSSRQFGVWTLNICRIVAVTDDATGDVYRYGFSYGTVGSHVLRGEERFVVQWDRTTDRVSFGIRRFSLPATRIIKLAGPLVRRAQARFLRDALARFHTEVRA